MAETHQSPRSFVAGGTISAYRRVKFSGTNVVHAGASDGGCGTSIEAASANGFTAIKLDIHGGTHKLEASGAISAGKRVYAAASGKAAGSGTVLIGWALDAASADGDIIEFVPNPGSGQQSSSSSSSSSSAGG